MQLFRQLKARKTKFGFEVGLRIENMANVGRALDSIREKDPTVLIEMRHMSSVTVTVHTDNEVMGQWFADMYCKD